MHIIGRTKSYIWHTFCIAFNSTKSNSYTYCRSFWG